MSAGNFFSLPISQEFFLLVFPLVLILAFFVIWRFHGQFFLRRKTIITEFVPPKEIGPAEAGIIFFGHVSNQSLTGEIIQLAVDGYISISSVSGSGLNRFDFRLRKLKDINDSDHWYRRVLVNLLFSSGKDLLLSEISQRLDGRGWSDLKNQLMFGLKSKGYYYRATELSKTIYITIGALFSYWLVLIFDSSSLAIFSGTITFVIIIFFGSFLTIKTAKGRKMAHYLAGFKAYLNVAERERLSFHNEPGKKFNNFEKVLPYAVALDVKGRWDNEFAKLFKQSQPGIHSFYGKDVDFE